MSALVVTTKNVELHTASQSILSSSSSASATSAASRLRRADLARAKLELAKARTQEAEALLEVCLADDEVAVGSQTGTVGRLEDVQSEVGSTSTPDLLTDGALRAPPTLPDDLPFSGVFVPNADSVATPNIYDVFSKDRGVHIINDILVPKTPQVAVRALSSQDGVSPPYLRCPNGRGCVLVARRLLPTSQRCKYACALVARRSLAISLYTRPRNGYISVTKAGGHYRHTFHRLFCPSNGGRKLAWVSVLDASRFLSQRHI